MKTRRGFWFWLFAVTLILSGVAWGNSYRWGIALQREIRGSLQVTVASGYCAWRYSSLHSSSTWGFLCASVDSTITKSWDDCYRATPFHFANFGVFPMHVEEVPTWGIPLKIRTWTIMVPLWFPTVLSGVGMSWRWWRWRKKRNLARRGFAVEPTSPIAHP